MLGLRSFGPPLKGPVKSGARLREGQAQEGESGLRSGGIGAIGGEDGVWLGPLSESAFPFPHLPIPFLALLFRGAPLSSRCGREELGSSRRLR